MGGLTRWWRGLPLPWRRWRVTHVADAVPDVPEELAYRRAAVVLDDAGEPDWLVFDCPCPQRHRVVLNLNPARLPVWLATSLNPLTIAPSIDQQTHRTRCHYFIRRGRVAWTNST